MIGPNADRGLQARRPIPRRLSRDAVDEIDADVVEAGLARGGEGPARLFRAVSTRQRMKVIVAQRLDPEADAGHARRPQAAPIGSLAPARICLEGDLLQRDASPIGPSPPR